MSALTKAQQDAVTAAVRDAIRDFELVHTFDANDHGRDANLNLADVIDEDEMAELEDALVGAIEDALEGECEQKGDGADA